MPALRHRLDDDREPIGSLGPEAGNGALSHEVSTKALSDDVDALVLEDELELDAGMTPVTKW
jgi:hypothetical protein